MAFPKNVVETLNNYSLFNNSIFDFILSLLLFIFVSTTLILTNKLIDKRLKLNTKRLEIVSGPSPLLVQKIQLLKFANKILNLPSIILISLYLGTQNLEFPSSLDTMLKIIIFGGLSFILINVIMNLIDHALNYQEQRIDQDYRHITEFLKLILKIVTVTFVTVWFLSNLGINVNTFIAGLGITGIAIAFALQQTISDFFASITLYFDKPFEIGDFIAVGGDSGTIEQIGLRSTQIRTLEGQLLIISNQDLTSARIHNYKKMDSRRVVQTIGVDYSTPYANLKQIPNLVKGIIDETEFAIFGRTHVTELASSTINIEIVYFINSKDYEVYMDAKQKIILKILQKFQELNINMPYPTQRLKIQTNPFTNMNVQN